MDIKGMRFGNASLDRIDNTKGYVEGNVQRVTAEANKMKLDHNQEYFISLCTLIHKKHGVKKDA